MGTFEIGFENYLPRLAQITILLISASWIAGITGVSHQCLTLPISLYYAHWELFFPFSVLWLFFFLSRSKYMLLFFLLVIVFSFFFHFPFFGQYGTWTQDPVVARQVLFHFSHTSQPPYTSLLFIYTYIFPFLLITNSLQPEAPSQKRAIRRGTLSYPCFICSPIINNWPEVTCRRLMVGVQPALPSFLSWVLTPFTTSR
jgi:hypothetical protein